MASRPFSEERFIAMFEKMQDRVHHNAVDKGFWADPLIALEGRVPDKEIRALRICRALLLVHTELSEATEAVRSGDPVSEKIPDFTNLEEELADTVIRIMDLSARFNLRLAQAIVRKHTHNVEDRPYLHGREF
ncbi:MAG: nucleotide pyrophosphohydrolase [Candidatus Altiarchaeales archaeon]|nr:nucleotide pyrophosphohydrolase [Candidatus Altiarchaeales archaeon]